MRSKQVIVVNAKSDIYTLQDLEGKLIAVQSTNQTRGYPKSPRRRYPGLQKDDIR